MIKSFIVIGVLALLMAGAVWYGISESGSPFDTRNKKFDAQRVTDLSNLSYGIESYYNKNSRFPTSFEELKKDIDNSYYTKNLADPETKINYEFIPGTSLDYKLCATFSTDSTTEAGRTTDGKLYGYSTPSGSKFDHPKGHHCFDLTVNYYNKPGYYPALRELPAPNPVQINSVNFGSNESSTSGKNTE